MDQIVTLEKEANAGFIIPRIMSIKLERLVDLEDQCGLSKIKVIINTVLLVHQEILIHFLKIV